MFYILTHHIKNMILKDYAMLYECIKYILQTLNCSEVLSKVFYFPFISLCTAVIKK